MKKKSTTRSAFFNLRVLIGLVVILTGLFLALLGFGTFSNALAQGSGAKQEKKSEEPEKVYEKPGIQVIPSFHNDISRPLWAAPTSWPPDGRGEHEANPNPTIPHHHVDAPDPVVQNTFFQKYVAPSIPGPVLNFDGIAYPGVSCNCAPPDTNGAIGKNHFVQMVNKGVQVFDKTTGASVLGPVSIGSFWSGFGGTCESGSGDPVVVYDPLADRFVISEFAVGTSVPQIECIAVSTTGDPTGTWYRYGFPLTTNFLDYPKLGVWPDGYYMAGNIFNTGGTAFLGPQAFVFDRAKMLIGAAATAITPGITGGTTEETFLPADLGGVIAPPPGTPNPFVAWPQVYQGNLVYKIWRFHADFATPANSTFTLFATPPAAAFTELCPTTRSCVPQSGTTSFLDEIGDRLMFRNAYRNINGGTLVNNYTVSANGVAGIRWFELRSVNAGPVTTPFQESTYQPDTTWRWMGSVAMDNQGNMALGFSASSSSIVPGLRYAGRLATDPVNVLAQGEATLFAGVGSQSVTGSRWGDYSTMTVDPVDDCTFWYTTEYYPAGATSFNWRTRIGNFKFAECTPPAKGAAHFIVTVCDGGSPLTGALVSIDGNLYGSSITGGIFDAALTPGLHTYAVTKPPIYGTATGNFNITNGQTTNVPVCLVGVPLIDPAGSTLVTEGCQPPNGAVDPNETVTVNLKLMNNGGASTTNLVATLQNSGGVVPTSGPQTYGVVAPGAMAERPFSFTAHGACAGTITATLQLQDGVTNLGTITYTFTLGNELILLAENFDGVTPPALPAGWTADQGVNAGGFPLWVTSNSGTPSPPADSLPNSAFTPDPNNLLDNRIYSTIFTYTSASSQLVFRHNFNFEQQSATVAYDCAVLEMAINGGAWTDIITAGGTFVTGGYNHTALNTGFSNPLLPSRPNWSGNSAGFITTVVNMPAAGVGQNVQLRWRMGSDTSVAVQGWRIDSVKVTGGFLCCGPQISSGASTIQTESCPPSNGAIDPNETVTVSFCVQNSGTQNTTNLVGTLQATGGVTNPSGPQTYGAVPAGGAAVCRSFTFTAAGTCGGTLVATIQLQDGATSLGTATYNFALGATGTSLTENFDGVAVPALPAGWLATNAQGPAPLWVTSNAGTPAPPADSLPNAAFVDDPNVVSDKLLDSPMIPISSASAQLTFRSNWTLETGFDGGVLEISINGGAFADILTAGGSFVAGGYTHTISTAFTSPIAGRMAWSASSSGFITTTANLPPSAAGQNIQLRWRMASDSTVAGVGWRIDNISISQLTCCVGSAPTVVSAVSRKVHGGGAGTFDVALPTSGAAGVECRTTGGTNDYTIVVTFANTVTVNGTPQAQVTLGSGTIGSAGVSNGGMVTVSGSIVTIPLTSVTNVQTINVRLNNVMDPGSSGNINIPMSVLWGDTNANRAVNSADVAQTKGRLGQVLTTTNFRSDVNANGAINSADVSIIKSNVGTGLPMP